LTGVHFIKFATPFPWASPLSLAIAFSLI